MEEGLGINEGTIALFFIASYFIIKWAVKNDVKEAYEEITGKEIKDDLDEFLEKEAAEKKTEKNYKLMKRTRSIELMGSIFIFTLKI